MPMDLGSIKSVSNFVDAFLAKYSELHLLINNAGIMACSKSKTSDGIEMQFGVNHLGHFHLTKLLLPLLEKTGATSGKPSRVVNLSSMGQFLFAPETGILFDDINGETSYKYSSFSSLIDFSYLRYIFIVNGKDTVKPNLPISFTLKKLLDAIKAKM
jgi:NAD(P)-dependent dehydrogenase (short-subunit alcohol dehydrogenase family)